MRKRGDNFARRRGRRKSYDERTADNIDTADKLAALDLVVVRAVLARLLARGWNPPTDLSSLAAVTGVDPATMTVVELGEAVTRSLAQDLDAVRVRATSPRSAAV